MRIANQEWANDRYRFDSLGSVELIKGASALKYGGDAVSVLYLLTHLLKKVNVLLVMLLLNLIIVIFFSVINLTLNGQ